MIGTIGARGAGKRLLSSVRAKVLSECGLFRGSIIALGAGKPLLAAVHADVRVQDGSISSAVTAVGASERAFASVSSVVAREVTLLVGRVLAPDAHVNHHVATPTPPPRRPGRATTTHHVSRVYNRLRGVSQATPRFDFIAGG